MKEVSKRHFQSVVFWICAVCAPSTLSLSYSACLSRGDTAFSGSLFETDFY